ncbi:MAG: DUF134 domain-containing protein [archaeon]
MPRPRRFRRVFFEPEVCLYKPAGIPANQLEFEVLMRDELEALRLGDSMGLSQDEAARKMDVSQPTFHRILSSARKKVSDALVNGKAIRIEGGSYQMAYGLGRDRNRLRGGMR